MARNNSVYRAGPKVVVAIDSIQHRLSETAFLELMQEALPLVERLVAERNARRAELQAPPVTDGVTPDGVKVRIAQNRWDNWYGYRAGRRVEQFFNSPEATQEQAAQAWLRGQLEQ